MTDDKVYTVHTDLPPNLVTALALDLFAKWTEFALGQRMLGGKKIMYPTGRYAASIQYKQEGEATVAIMADSEIAPEAGILETGHRPVDLKTKLKPGIYPMHRATGQVPGKTPKIWAKIREGNANGFASIGPNSDPDSWIVPAMPAYAPAQILAAMAQAAADKMR